MTRSIGHFTGLSDDTSSDYFFCRFMAAGCPWFVRHTGDPLTARARRVEHEAACAFAEPEPD